MPETLPTRRHDHELHGHAHLSTTVTTTKLRRHHTPTAVLYTPQSGATWLANTIAAHSTDAVAVEWGTPRGVLIDTPGAHNDVERGAYALAHGGSVDALVLTTTGDHYPHIAPHTREQCPHHKPQNTNAVRRLARTVVVASAREEVHTERR